MTINGRLLLLAAVIALFGRVWTTNDRIRVRPIVRHHVVQTLAARSNESVLVATPVSEQRSLEETRSPSRTERWTAIDCPVDLPAGMASGTYRVVNDTGRVAELTVTDETVSDSQMPGSDSELFVITVGQERWFFIRLRTNPAPVGLQASLTTEPTVQAAPFPEFDAAALDPEFAPEDLAAADDGAVEVTGLESAVPAEAPVIEEAARPRPPEMPSPL